MLLCSLPLSALLLHLCSAYAAAFIFQPATQTGYRRRGDVLLFAELVVNEEFNPKEVFPLADFEDFRLLPHRPLGVRIEESLADSNYVFVTRVEEGGLASQAGIQVGDVLVGVTGLFGDMTCSIGLGVERM
jgi:predicted metalloprotease with PDZ domain